MKRARRMIVLIAVAVLPLLLTGCWDNREIDSLFILTGTAIDVTDNPDQIAITLQVAKIGQSESGSGADSGAGGDSSILLHAASDSVLNGVTEINRDSDRKLLFQHNRIRLFGVALAERGIKKHLDLFLRDQQARLEVPLVVVDGRAEEALAASLSQESISGIFLGGMFEDLSKISPAYRVRLIDFVHKILGEGAAPVIPIINVTGEEGKQQIKLAGMGVFKGDSMIGRLSNDETLGYIWSLGNVKECSFEVTDASSKAILRISTLDCKRDVTLREDGGVHISLTIHALAGIGELSGFQALKPSELLKRLQNLGEQEIEKKIRDCFAAAQGLNADIFEYCTMVYQKYPRQWAAMKNRWDAIFPTIELSVQVKVRIPGTGQIVQSLEMEEGMK